MCILCVIQKWSRRVATMLPWLVIPLIGLWALSQLLPPAFRFEITSPRLACVFVLLVTLFWYEVLMPQLSAWRARRNARLRAKKRTEAIELQKLRKTAIRRCRNCLTPYKDQNPGGGRFMCSYCGHISKRPVLDLPASPGFSNTGIIRDLVGKSGKILNGKAWSDNGWIYGQDWLENGNWGSGSVAGKPTYWRKNGGSLFGEDEHCLAEKSYSGVALFSCKLLTSFFLSIRWLGRKMFRVSSAREDTSSDAEHGGMLVKRGDNGVNLQESKGEKARRKAEEKRQARLEKELLEEEERKQREEVARLVEERRRLRDEKVEAEKGRSTTSLPVRERDRKREAEKKRQERRKEKDKGSSKSNSDAEELEKRAVKESEKKRDFDKKSEIDRRETQKSPSESVKSQNIELGHGINDITSTYNITRGAVRNRYLDRMRGTIWSSSRAFGGGGFFGKSSYTSTTTSKESKSGSSVDHGFASGHRRDLWPPERADVKHVIDGDEKNGCHPVIAKPQPVTAPKKSWQQLFTRSPSVQPSTNVNVISRPTPKHQPDVQNSQSVQLSSTQTYDNPIDFGLPSPFLLPTFPNGSPNSTLGFSPAIEPIFPRSGEGTHEFISEEPELFEDPCYNPDLVSLLGPVSESLESFQLDKGTGFAHDIGLERPSLKNIAASPEVNKPSPIESPLSREKNSSFNRFASVPKTADMQTVAAEFVNANEKGTWQMWNSAPLVQDGLGLVGGASGWFQPPDQNKLNSDDFLQPPSQKTMMSLFGKDDQGLCGANPHQTVFRGNGHGAGTFAPVSGSSDCDPWLGKALFPPLSGIALKPQDENNQKEVIFGSPSTSVTNLPFQSSQASCWSRKEWALQGAGEVAGKPYVVKSPVGGVFPAAPDV